VRFVILKKVASEASDDGVAPQLLVYHWMQTIDGCAEQGMTATSDSKMREDVILLSRILVARYIYIDFLLVSEFKDRPKCREKYMDSVAALLFNDENEAETARLFGEPYEKWFTKTAKDIAEKMASYSKQEKDMPLAYYLAKAACSFIEEFKNEKLRIVRAVNCLNKDLELAHGVVEAAGRMCNQ